MEALGLLLDAYCELITLGGSTPKRTALLGLLVAIPMAGLLVALGTRNVVAGGVIAGVIFLLYGFVPKVGELSQKSLRTLVSK